MTSVVIDQITTADAAPNDPPYRISDKPEKDTLTIKFTVDDDSDESVRAWVIRLEPTGPLDGLAMSRRGIVCGDGSRCGTTGAVPLALPPGTQVAEEVTYEETGPAAEGDHTAGVFAHSATEGWSG